MENPASLHPLVEGQKTAMPPAISPGPARVGSLRHTLKRALMGIGLFTALATASDSTEPAQAVSKEKHTFQEATNTTVAASHNLLSSNGSSPTSIKKETQQKISKSVPSALQPLKKTSSINQPLLLNIEAPKEPLDEVAHFTLPKPRMNFIDMGNTPNLSPKARFVKPPEINSDKQNNADHNKTSHSKKKHKPILEFAIGPTMDTNGTHTLAGGAAEVGFPGVEVIPDVVRIGGVLFGKGLGGIDQKGVHAYAVEAGPIVSYHLAETRALGRHIGVSAFVSGTLGYEYSKHKDEAAHSFMGAGGVGINVEDQESHNFASVETGVGCIVRSTNPEEERKCVNSTTVLVGHAF